jgi:hypothetical protein
MSDPADPTAILNAWLEAQQALARLAGSAAGAQAAASTSPEQLADLYRRIFEAPGLRPPAGAPIAGIAAMQRYQAATQQFGMLLNEAAVDAGRRLAAVLAASGPDAPPVTSLHELRGLWIDCGEAAWSEAAHREVFASALAELLAAWASLRATEPAA